MKHLILFCCAILPLCMGTNAGAFTGVDGYLQNFGIATQCYVPTAAGDANDASEAENQQGKSSQEEEAEPDCD